jgi:hypothetical protein
MAIKYDLSVDKGATYIKPFTWFDPPPNPNPAKLLHGDPKDLTGFSARMQARLDPQAPDPLFTIDTTTGGITIVGGTITIRLEASTTGLFNFDMAYYDLKLTSSDGTATRLVEGKLKVSIDITR